MDSSKITQSFLDRRTQILDSCLDAIGQTPCINLTLTTTPEDIKRKKEHHSIVMSSDIITYDEELQDLCSKAEAIIVTLFRYLQTQGYSPTVTK